MLVSMGHPAVKLETVLVLVACTDEAMVMFMVSAVTRSHVEMHS